MNPSTSRVARMAALGALAVALGLAMLPQSATARTDDAARTGGDRVDLRQAYDRTAQARDVVRLDLLAFNDFHGNLAPISSTSSSGRINNTPAGGVEYLSTHLQRLRNKARFNGAETLTVAAGDLVGASPLLSAAFYDEPTIEALNELGLDVSAVGNHEFDEGYRELQRLQRGGCIDDGAGADNQDSCPGGKTFEGADFQYLAANVVKKRTGKTILRGTAIREVDGIKVGFIGMTLEGTPDIVSQAGIRGLRFDDEVETANALVPTLKQRGAEAIVVLVHEGGVPIDPTAYDACPGVSGPIIDIAKNLHPEIDAVVSGHTHQPYNCVVKDPAGRMRSLTSAASFGRIITDIHLLLDRATGDVVRPAAYAQNRIVTRTVREDPSMTDLIAFYTELVADIANEVIGYTTTTILDDPDPDGSGDSALGNLIADSQRVFDGAVAPGDTGPADVAFMNPGGIRADLVPNGDGAITYGAAFTVQPFNNYVVSMDMTGEDILALLEEQWSGTNAGAPKVLQVSNLTYTWDPAAEPGNRVVDGSVEIGGAALVPGDTYRVAANSFLSDGGDGFATFRDATNKYIGGLDFVALQEYLSENSSAAAPYAPTPTDRIDVLD